MTEIKFRHKRYSVLQNFDGWYWAKRAAIAGLIICNVPIMSHGQGIVLPKKESSIKTFLREIKQQSGLDFVYNDRVINDNKVISVYAENEPIEEVLDRSLKQVDLVYNIKDNIIVVDKKRDKAKAESVVVKQVYRYQGQIKGTAGKLLSGATIKIFGQHAITQTNEAGFFEFNYSESKISIEISAIGYAATKMEVNANTILDITLQESISDLDEIVIVGYGTQSRKHLTAAVSQVDAKALTRAPAQNLSNMLTGKLPGLTSKQSSGKPGADGAALYIRGINSFSGSNSPMILVDGVPRLLDYVNPNDVESVTILKDAAAAIYGIQGANGVIQITTKKGKIGAAKIQYDGATTLTQNTAMPEFLNAPDYMYWHNKAREMDGLTPIWNAEIQNKVMSDDPNSVWGQTDWLDKIFRTGVMQNHNVSATGGTEKTRYYTSLGIMNQEGTLINTDLRRINVRTNLDIEVAKKLKFMANLAGHRIDRHWPGTSIGEQTEFNPVRQAISTIPIIKSEYEGLPTAWNGSVYRVNGYAALNESGYFNMNNWTFDTNAKLEYDASGISSIFKNLKLSIFGAYNYSNTINSDYARFYSLYTVNDKFDEYIGGASGFSSDNVYAKSSSWGDSYLWRPEISYSAEINKHSIGALLLFEAKKNYSNTMTGTKRGYYSDEPVDLSLGTELPTTPISGSHGFSGGQNSYLGKFNYGFNNTYLAEVAFRYDGSYIFAPENRWGFFPSASVAWVISNESFFANKVNNINLLKLRASYGNTGNDGVSPFQHNSLFAIANNSMVLGGESISQFYATNAYLYRNLKWASTDNYNIGADLDMWNGKLGVELNLFYKLTKDILESQGGNYPSSLGGYFPSYVNSGRVENKGFELVLKHSNRINSDWAINVEGHVAFAKNKVLSRIVSDNRPSYRALIGESIGARYGFQALGLFQSLEEIDNYPTAPSGTLRLGDIKYLDVNGDGIISSTYDYIKMGYGGIPEINFGLDLSLAYKSFNLSMLWQGVSHVDIELSGVYDTGVTSSTVYTSTFTGSGNSPNYLVEDSWTPENTNARYPRLTTVGNGNNAWQSTWWLINGEFLRLKNLNFSYSIPQNIIKKTPFSGVNIYLAGTNLLTLSHFKYIDPESPSVSNGYYPQQKTYSLGLNLTF